MVGSAVNRATILARDIYDSPFSDDDSEYDLVDKEFLPPKVFGRILYVVKKESLDFMEAWAEILRRKREGSWQLACA
jgi:hypothetical protein